MKLNTEHRTRRLSVAALVTATALHVSAVLASDAPPQASIQQAKGHQIMLTVTGSPGQMYTLQMATNLTGWSFVTGGVVPDQMDLSNLDSGWTNSPAAFFRAIPTDASDSSLEGCDYRPAPQWFVYLSGAPMPLVAWVALWVITFALLSLLMPSLRQISSGVVSALQHWSAERSARAAEEDLWNLAQCDYRMLDELRAARSRDL